MCTLILGLSVVEPGSLLVAANRDEDPHRPSHPPLVLRETPHVIGGRDALAGGTWLAIRDRNAVTAMLNRRWNGLAPAAPDPRRRSRGLLTIDVAGVETPGPSGALAAAALGRAHELLASAAYDPFSLVFATRETGWVLSHDAERPPRVTPLTPGWHVLTHADLDDRTEPRTAWLLDRIAGFRPTDLEQAERRLLELLASHGRSEPAPGEPAVCLHAGRMVTVSSAIVAFTGSEARYRHVEGRPCVAPPKDCSPLFDET